MKGSKTRGAGSSRFLGDLLCAVDSAGIGLARIGPDECVEDVNPAFAAAVGWTAPRLKGRNWRSLVHDGDRERTAEAVRAALSGVARYLEVRSLCAGGRSREMALTVAPRPSGGGVLFLRHDISCYRADRDALALAVESAPSGLLLLDGDGRIRMANAAVERIFGYSRQELAGKTVEILVPERFREKHLRHRHSLGPHLQVPTMDARDLVGRRRDGAEIPLQVYLNTIDTPSARLVVVTVIDVAERVRYETEIEMARQAAESANRAKSDFLARMSHEIRTPMNLILGMNAMLLESNLTERQRMHLEICHRNVKRLLRLINGILDLSKVEAGRLLVEATPFSLDEVLDECVATISAAIEQKGLAFRLDIDSTAWRYWIGDRERLQQVLLNLIGNAEKFTEQGRIEIRVRKAERADGAEGLQFEVADTGCGVPAAQSKLIFESFHQGDGAINRRYEGTGLGLAIARSLVRLMGGDIWLADRRDPGSTFVFSIFLQKCSRETVYPVRKKPRRATPPPSRIRAGTRILLAEDNPENSFLVQTYLEDLPLLLDFAEDGADALRKRRTQDYDLILMDIQMPVMDGYTATREIRAWEQANGRPPVPVVALTAHALTGAAAEAREAGCDAHLAKPVEREDLVEAIARHASAKPLEPRGGGAQITAAKRREFLDKRRGDLARLREALDAADFPVVQTIGHNCKGIGKGFGFPVIGLAGSALEEAARARDLPATEAALQAFSQAVEQAGDGAG